MNNVYRSNAIALEVAWNDEYEKRIAALIKYAEKELNVSIPELIRVEASENATLTCNGDINEFLEIFYSSLIHLAEDKLINVKN